MRNGSSGIQIGPVTITGFALIVVAALLVGVAVTAYRARRSGFSRAVALDLGSAMLFFGLITSRLVYVLVPPPSAADFYSRDWYLAHPLDLLVGPIAIWNGGLDPAGAIVGGLIGALIVLLRKRLDVWQWSDMLLPGIMSAMILLPWANMAEAQMLGPATGLAWGITVDTLHLHPTPAYVSLWCAIACAAGMAVRARYGKQWAPGTWAVVTALITMPGLFLAEFLRVDASRVFLGLSTVQALCGVFEIVLAATLIWRSGATPLEPGESRIFTEN